MDAPVAPAPCLPQMAAGAEVCRAVTKASRSNFSYAFLFLPRANREALYAVYAFCRLTDDLVDEAARIALPNLPADAPPLERLHAWRAELEACGRGRASHPVTRRLAEVMRAYQIPLTYFVELVNGAEMDLTQSRYATFADLQTYCYRVAGVVGLTCIQVFGYRCAETRVYAERLGTAFQLTNILRDVGSDAARGRIYLPQEDLARFGCTEAELLEGRMTPRIRELLAFQARRAREVYAAAREALPQADRRSMLPAEIMRAIYG
ncbi:MAG TPA: presqualene diphosphate synthase HpnD, partial [Candidatus Sulfotelmatobacter sp.]|nr:presqualene diphosphate synthase HpnD [Candidatus Sulfotelmatobacter sp.]